MQNVTAIILLGYDSWHKTGIIDWYNRGLYCHAEGPQEAAETGREESRGVEMQSRPWGRNNPRHQYVLGLNGWEAAWETLTLGSWWARWPQEINAVLLQGWSVAAWAALGRCCQQVKQGNLTLIHSTCEMYLQCWVQFLRLQYKNDMDFQHVAMKMIYETRVPARWGKAERSATVQPGEEKAQGFLSMCTNMWWEDI